MRVIKVAKKLTKGKRKYLSGLISIMDQNARAEKLRNARITMVVSDLRDYRGRRAVDVIW